MQNSKAKIIAVDGPAGSGKSSLCQELCEQQAWTYVNTGALYRAVAYIAQSQYGNYDQETLRKVVEDFRQHYRWQPESGELFYRNEPLNPLLHTRELGPKTSLVAKDAAVREQLLPVQRQLAMDAPRAAVMDGRDIGSVVFPDADLKIFLTASLQERAQRRLAQLQSANAVNLPNLSDLEEEISLRDQQDSSRDQAPLVQAKDAVVFDTSGISLEEAKRQLLALIFTHVPELKT